MSGYRKKRIAVEGWLVGILVGALLLAGVHVAAQEDGTAAPPTALGEALQSERSRQADTVEDTAVYLPLLLGEAAPNDPAPTPTPAPVRGESYPETVARLTNAERAAHGCPPVTLETRLTLAAQAHSEDMAINNFFSHTGSDGSSPGDRISRAGYNWRSYGENIAAGYTTPEAVVTAWMDSPGHRANILTCGFDHLGIGYVYAKSTRYQHYWTMKLASEQ